MFKDNLLQIDKDIRQISQQDVMEKVVTDRLNKSLLNYVDNLEETCQYILSQDPKIALRLLNKK